MNKEQIKYLLSRTIQESLISIFSFVDFIIPDLTIFSSFRKLIIGIFWNVNTETRIRKGFRATRLGRIKIGKNCYINQNNFFDNDSLIEIGDNCSIGFENKFLTINHIEKDKTRDEVYKTFYSKPIKIGNNVWITSNCVILPGSEVGDNSIISAGSIVIGKLEGGWIYGGNPLKVIKKTEGILPKKY